MANRSPVKAARALGERQVPVEDVCGIEGGCLCGSYATALVLGRSNARIVTVPGISSLVGNQPVKRVCLPRNAPHVSRVHAVVRWVPFATPLSNEGAKLDGAFIVKILGQNGLIVDGKRHRAGRVLRLVPGQSTLDFFGTKLNFVAPVRDRQQVIERAHRSAESPVKRTPAANERDTTPGPLSRALAEPSSPMHNISSSPTPSSPPPVEHVHEEPQSPSARVASTGRKHVATGAHDSAGASQVPVHDTNEQAPADVVPETQPEREPEPEPEMPNERRSADPENMPTNTPPAEQDPPSPTPAAEPTEAPQAKLDKAQPTLPAADFSAPDSKPVDLDALADELVARISPTYDLTGLLAGAIVFHRTATISASEAVRSVLVTNPGMMRGEAGARIAAFSPSKRKLHTNGQRVPECGEIVSGWLDVGENTRWAAAARRAWHDRLAAELASGPMFGEIQRPGKDRSGNALESWFHYDKENDPDEERAVNLGAFAKPMRKAVRSQKPIFWKRSEFKKATSVGSEGEPDKLPYSPRAPDSRKRQRRDEDQVLSDSGGLSDSRKKRK